MFINKFINKVQLFFEPLYKKSYVLQNIDWLICINIFCVIFSSTVCQSDNIGYFALAAIILTIIKMLTKNGERFELSLSDILLLTYLMFVVISVAGSTLLCLSLKGFFKTFTYIGFYVSVVKYLQDNKDKIKYIFVAFCLCALYETIFALLQHFSAVEEISGWQDMSHLNPEDVMTRVYGTLKPYNPNLFGGYMLALTPAFITLPFINKKLTFLAIIGGLLSLLTVILTGCRGAYIGLFIMLTVLTLITYKLVKPEYKKLFSYIIGVFASITAFTVISINSLRVRIFSIFAMRGDSSNSFRFNVYNSCINMFKDNWLLGIGCGNQNFREIYGLYMKTGFDALSAYNIYLETAVESGVFALITFVSFLIVKILKALKYIFSHNSIESVFVLAALISILGFMSHGIVDTVFFRPQLQFTFWMMIGIIRVLGE